MKMLLAAGHRHLSSYCPATLGNSISCSRQQHHTIAAKMLVAPSSLCCLRRVGRAAGETCAVANKLRSRAWLIMHVLQMPLPIKTHAKRVCHQGSCNQSTSSQPLAVPHPPYTLPRYPGQTICCRSLYAGIPPGHWQGLWGPAAFHGSRPMTSSLGAGKEVSTSMKPRRQRVSVGKCSHDGGSRLLLSLYMCLNQPASTKCLCRPLHLSQPSQSFYNMKELHRFSFQSQDTQRLRDPYLHTHNAYGK